MRFRTIAVVFITGVIAVSSLTTAAPLSRRYVIDSVLTSEEGNHLSRILRSDEKAKKVIEDAINNGIPGWSDMNTAKAITTLKLMLEVEVKNLSKAKEQIEDIAQRYDTLNGSIGDYLMDPEQYGAMDDDTDVIKASKWIHHASNTVRDNNQWIQSVANILSMAVRILDLSKIADLEQLNRILVDGDRAQQYRPISLAGGQLPSSTGGRYLLELMLNKIENQTQGDNLGAYLLGAIVRSHGFADGNGRTGRAAYAISILKARRPRQSFRALNQAGENKLHGLDN